MTQHTQIALHLTSVFARYALCSQSCPQLRPVLKTYSTSLSDFVYFDCRFAGAVSAPHRLQRWFSVAHCSFGRRVLRQMILLCMFRFIRERDASA